MNTSSSSAPVNSVNGPELTQLCQQLTFINRRQTDWSVDHWPDQQLDLLARAGIYRWFVSSEQGGLGWSADDIATGYIALASACLPSTFIVTQRVAAMRRIACSDNENFRSEHLPKLLAGQSAATVGVSHLTTSGRHLKKPVLQLKRTNDGLIADGAAPWVTGATHVDRIVLGGSFEDGTEALFCPPITSDGISVERGFDMVALSATHTGVVKCDHVAIDENWILAGPVPAVMHSGTGGGAGGVQTSALALGLAKAAIDFIGEESSRRSNLVDSYDALRDQFELLRQKTLEVAAGTHRGTPGQDTVGQLRSDANSLVMRSTQAAMIAAKGAGFVEGHPVGRWCREALFFLVWSCPQSVSDSNLCELAAT